APAASPRPAQPPDRHHEPPTDRAAETPSRHLLLLLRQRTQPFTEHLPAARADESGDDAAGLHPPPCARAKRRANMIGRSHAGRRGSREGLPEHGVRRVLALQRRLADNLALTVDRSSFGSFPTERRESRDASVSPYNRSDSSSDRAPPDDLPRVID